MASDKISKEEIMQKLATGKPFILLLLLTGETTPPANEDESNSIQFEHLTHLFQMEKEGKCSVFGPVANDEKLRDIIIFNTTDKGEVHQWMKDDPWIKRNCLRYELYDWFTIPGQTIPV